MRKVILHGGLPYFRTTCILSTYSDLMRGGLCFGVTLLIGVICVCMCEYVVVCAHVCFASFCVSMMMEHVFLTLSCCDLAACSFSCRRWLDILKHGFLWAQYGKGVGLPVPLLNYGALRQYLSCSTIMRGCWLRYKVYVDRRMRGPRCTGQYPWQCRKTNKFFHCDSLHLGCSPCQSGSGIASPLREALQNLFAIFGAVPRDYVVALETIWLPGRDVALGDVVLVRGGVPEISDMCKDPVTAICSVSIGSIWLNGCDLQYEVHELVMSFRVGPHGRAFDVCYTCVCHEACVYGDEPWCRPFGEVNAAAAVACLGMNLEENKYDILSNAIVAFRTLRSFADCISVCIECVERRRVGFFVPCLLSWMSVHEEDDEDPGWFDLYPELLGHSD